MKYEKSDFWHLFPNLIPKINPLSVNYKYIRATKFPKCSKDELVPNTVLSARSEFAETEGTQ